jgi:hypothetical protein
VNEEQIEETVKGLFEVWFAIPIVLAWCIVVKYLWLILMDKECD